MVRVALRNKNRAVTPNPKYKHGSKEKEWRVFKFWNSPEKRRERRPASVSCRRIAGANWRTLHFIIGAITISTRWQSWRNMSSQPTTRSAFFLGFLHPTVTYLTSRSNIVIQLGRYLQLRIPNCNCSGLCHRNSNNHLQNLNQKMERKKKKKNPKRVTRERAKDKARESERRRERANASARDSAI